MRTYKDDLFVVLCTCICLVQTYTLTREPPLLKSNIRIAHKRGNVQTVMVAKNLARQQLPKLIVFDLDNTLWTPELYQLKFSPKAGKDIRLFDDVQEILSELATEKARWTGTRIALASRTNQVAWAQALLPRFEVAPGVTLKDLVSFAEIVPGSKRRHFGCLKRDSGVGLDEMLFFDDSTMNTREIEAMGVLCVHCPKGLTKGLWELGLSEYAEMKARGETFMGRTLSAPKSRGAATARPSAATARPAAAATARPPLPASRAAASSLPAAGGPRPAGPRGALGARGEVKPRGGGQ